MQEFDDFWKVYPHFQQRSKKAICRALFLKITGAGHTSKVEGLDITTQTTPGVLVSAAKAYHMTLIKTRTPASGENRDYVPGAQVWLNQGRFEDMEDAERIDLANQYDQHKARVMERARLRVV